MNKRLVRERKRVELFGRGIIRVLQTHSTRDDLGRAVTAVPCSQRRSMERRAKGRHQPAHLRRHTTVLVISPLQFNRRSPGAR